MAQLQITELDFSGIKQNLRNFLQAQDEFSDYNFEGSALSVLIDLLAYNTHYHAVLAHLMSNEMFLDSAIKRSSVLSIAKTLGYVPRSKTGARIRANIVVAGGSSSSLTLPVETVFSGSVDGTTYVFSPTIDYTVPLSGGQYTFNNVELIEGKRLSNTFTVTTENRSGPFIVPVDSLDINTVAVYVKPTVSSTAFEVYNRVDTISGLNNTSKVYWIEERADGRYQVLFGDNIFGRSLEVGNQVIVEYVAVAGPDANGVNALFGSVVDGQNILSITVLEPAAGGSEKESIDSIRKTAPLFNAAKNRAVTTQDYQALIQKNFDKAKAVTVWGGEENDPPIYGKVFITIDAMDDYIFTEADKDFIIEKILRPASVMSIQHEFVDPDYLYVGVHTHVNYDPRLTNFSASQIASSVREEIRDYFTQELSTLEKPFFASKLNDVINGASNSIVANVTKISLQIRVSAQENQVVSKTINFLAAIEPETVRSTIFSATVNGITYPAFIQDFSDSDARRSSTNGTLKLVAVDSEQVVATVGTIDYTTGKVVLNNLPVAGFLTNSGEIRINAEPTDLSKNITSTIVRTTEISTNAVTPLASRNIIIKLDDSESDSTIQLTPGLQVSATPFIGN